MNFLLLNKLSVSLLITIKRLCVIKHDTSYVTSFDSTVTNVTNKLKKR